MRDYQGAGRLDQPAQVLECRRSESGAWKWTPIRDIWVSAEHRTKINIFSHIAVGARAVDLVTWRQDVTLHNAIRMGSDHLFLTEITEQNRNQLRLRAAVCEPVTLKATPSARSGRDDLTLPIVTPQPSFGFPGILAELYYKHESDEVFHSALQRRALITPKAVALRLGDLVQSDGEPGYVVRQVMDLDHYKNEYVVERQEDV